MRSPRSKTKRRRYLFARDHLELLGIYVRRQSVSLEGYCGGISKPIVDMSKAACTPTFILFQALRTSTGIRNPRPQPIRSPSRDDGRHRHCRFLTSATQPWDTDGDQSGRSYGFTEHVALAVHSQDGTWSFYEDSILLMNPITEVLVLVSHEAGMLVRRSKGAENRGPSDGGPICTRFPDRESRPRMRSLPETCTLIALVPDRIVQDVFLLACNPQVYILQGRIHLIIPSAANSAINPSENSFEPVRTGTKAGRSGTKMGEQELRRANRDETWQIHAM